MTYATTYATVLPIWQAIQKRFHKTVRAIPEAELSLSLNGASIGYMLRHNAEVEYMFAEWFFGAQMPQDLVIETSRGARGAQTERYVLEELVSLLEASNAHLLEAMRILPEERWHIAVYSPTGPSTPLEAVGRLMYHTGIHAGQISQIRKFTRADAPAGSETASR